MSGFQRRFWCAWLLAAAAAVAGCGRTEGQLFEKTIPAPSLRGNSIGEPVEQPIAVYLPPGYASDARQYPALYLVPDRSTGVSAFLDGTYQGFSLLEAMDRLIADRSLDKMIVVVVNGRNVLGEGFFTQSPADGEWERYLVRDVVRYVDRHYKTLPFRETRGIAGYTSGAAAALRMALRYPDVFSAVYAMSPVRVDDFDATIRAYRRAEVALDGIVVAVGTAEPRAQIVEACRSISQRLDDAGIPHRPVTFDGAHPDDLRERLEGHVLPFFSGALVLE